MPLPAASFDLFDTQSDGCASVDPGASGKFALIDRGACTFSQKVANAKAAGAIAVVIINNVAGDPSAMARTAGFDDDMPAVMIGKERRRSAARIWSQRLLQRSQHSRNSSRQANKDILAGFSSQGPTNVDFAVKPDIDVGWRQRPQLDHVCGQPGCPVDGSGVGVLYRHLNVDAAYCRLRRPCSCNCMTTGHLRKSSRRS